MTSSNETEAEEKTAEKTSFAGSLPKEQANPEASAVKEEAAKAEAGEIRSPLVYAVGNQPYMAVKPDKFSRALPKMVGKVPDKSVEMNEEGEEENVLSIVEKEAALYLNYGMEEEPLKGAVPIFFDKVYKCINMTLTQIFYDGKTGDPVLLKTVVMSKHSLYKACHYQGSYSNFCRKLRAVLDALWHAKFTVKEAGEGARDVRILQERPTKSDDESDDLVLVVTDRFYKYILKEGAISQIALKILAIDERATNTYRVACFWSARWSDLQYYNPKFNKCGKPGAYYCPIKLLLRETDLPTLKHLKSARHSWIERIKKPLEKILDGLVSEFKIIRVWQYCTKDGHVISKDQLEQIISGRAEEYMELYIRAIPKDAKILNEHMGKRQGKRLPNGKSAVSKPGVSKPGVSKPVTDEEMDKLLGK